MRRIVFGLLAGAVALALTVAPASAQTEVSGGFALADWNGCCAYGFAADVSQPFYRNKRVAVSGVGDFGWTRFSGEETDTSFVGGVRFKFMRDKAVSFFAQGTTGVVHWSEDAFGPFQAMSGNDYVIGGGGGIQIRLTDTLDIKPFQIDWWVLPNDENDTIMRVTFGVAFKLGR